MSIDELAEAHNAVVVLAAENDALKDRIAVEAMIGSEQEKVSAFDYLRALRSEITRLEIENRALVDGRNAYQRENSALKRLSCKTQAEQVGNSCPPVAASKHGHLQEIAGLPKGGT